MRLVVRSRPLRYIFSSVQTVQRAASYTASRKNYASTFWQSASCTNHSDLRIPSSLCWGMKKTIISLDDAFTLIRCTRRFASAVSERRSLILNQNIIRWLASVNRTDSHIALCAKVHAQALCKSFGMNCRAAGRDFL